MHTRSLPLDAMIGLARTRDAAAVAAELSAAFLFTFASSSNALPTRTATPIGPAARPAPPRFWVLRRNGMSAHPFLTVGRLDGNDVPIPDVSVSRFHAMIFEDADGFSIVDAGSKLGTFVDDVAVPRRGAPPQRLRSRQMLRFGAASAMFVVAADAIAIALSHSWSG